jgi:hypothetical protein
MQSKVTRRQLAATLTGGALLAQAPTPPLPKNPEEELKAARDDAKQRADQLAKVSIPMSTEPSFVFKA